MKINNGGNWMNNLNSVLMEGNLTKDPETKKVGDSTICEISIATNRYYKQDNKYEQEVSYFDIKCWNKLAEVCKKYLKKGRGIRVIGRLKQERWEKDGVKKSKVIISAEHIEFKQIKKQEE